MHSARFSALLGFALLFITHVAAAADALRVGSISAAPGEKVSGELVIAPRGDDQGTEIPVTLVNGREAGPTLALIAGVHGYEYPGITALQELRSRVEPDDLAGAVIIVHIANPPAFLGRTIYTSPADGMNLNRAFPGRADGSLSERIAFALTTEVIEQADYMIDLHAGDGNERLRPYVYMPLTGDAAFDAAARGLAEAFGLDTVVIDRTPVTAPEDSQLTDMTAWSRGIPAITTETGQLGSNDRAYVAMAVAGLENVLRHLDMLPGEVRAAPPIVWLEDFTVVRSPRTGIFRAAVEEGYVIAEGGRLGTLVDFFGNEIAEIRAPFTGVVNYVLGTPPVSEGEPLAMVSRIRDGAP